MNVYYIGILANLGINLLGALSVYVILCSGQISVGNAGFMAVGAYCAAILSAGWEVPIWAAILAGGALAAACGVLVGVPALRLQGTYLVIGTISFSAMIRSLAQVMEVTGGAAGFRGIARMEVREIFLFVLLVMALLYGLERTRMGLSIRAAAADSRAAGSMGVNVTALKVFSFALGAGVAGIGGGCYAHWVQYIEPGDFSTMTSTMMVLAVILGGRTRLLGVVTGAAVFTVLPELLRFASTWRMVAYGVLVILIVIYRPEGLVVRGRKKKRERQEGAPC